MTSACTCLTSYIFCYPTVTFSTLDGVCVVSKSFQRQCCFSLEWNSLSCNSRSAELLSTFKHSWKLNCLILFVVLNVNTLITRCHYVHLSHSWHVRLHYIEIQSEKMPRTSVSLQSGKRQQSYEKEAENGTILICVDLLIDFNMCESRLRTCARILFIYVWNLSLCSVHLRFMYMRLSWLGRSYAQCAVEILFFTLLGYSQNCCLADWLSHKVLILRSFFFSFSLYC